MRQAQELKKNFGSNNTVGFVVTDKGVVLIGSGAMPAGAKVIHQAIQEITSKPILWVVNIGAQDHHWLGNSYFVKTRCKSTCFIKNCKKLKNTIQKIILIALNQRLESQLKPSTQCMLTKPITKITISSTLAGLTLN